MKIETIGAVLLFSENPERLVAYYRDTLGLPLEEENHPGSIPHFACEVGGTHFAIHHTRVNRGKGGVAFSLVTDDLGAVESLHPPIDMGDTGRRTTINDPDGNTVSLVQFRQ